MVNDSKMVEIIRKIGEDTPPPIRLSRLFQSPDQDFFSFRVATEGWRTAATVLDLLAKASVNIRFISEYTGENGEVAIRLCVDAGFGEKALQTFQSEEVSRTIQDLQHRCGVRILSVYPFDGQPQIAGRIFTAFAMEHVEILAANSATSVFSCVVALSDANSAVSCLKRAFVLP